MYGHITIRVAVNRLKLFKFLAGTIVVVETSSCGVISVRTVHINIFVKMAPEGSSRMSKKEPS